MDFIGLYDMPELAEYVDLTRFTPKRNKNPEEIGLGRNVTLFDELRKWAYRQVKKYKADGGYKEWLDACNAWALNRNGEFKAPSGPLDEREVWHIAKSVAKWTWTRFDIAASDKRFSELQAIRGQKGGIAKGVANEDKRATARLMRQRGMTQVAIAAELNVNQSSVARWVADL